MTPWNNLIRLLTPPRMRTGKLLMAILDSLLHRTTMQAEAAERHRDQIIDLYSNIPQRRIVENLLNAQFPGHNIWIEDTSRGSIILFERPNYTPNNTHRQIAGSNYERRLYEYRNGQWEETISTRTHGDGGPLTTTPFRRRIIIRSTPLSFADTDLIVHQTGLTDQEIDQLRQLLSRLLFLGVSFQIVTP